MSAASQSLTVHVPLALRQRGGRKLIVTPSGTPAYTVPRNTRADPTLVKALARAFRWKRLLENGTYASISEMAATEKIDRGYLGRILLLTLLAPDIVEAILDGRQPPELGLPKLLEPFPLIWSEQRLALQMQTPSFAYPVQNPGKPACSRGAVPDRVARQYCSSLSGHQHGWPNCILAGGHYRLSKPLPQP